MTTLERNLFFGAAAEDRVGVGWQGWSADL
jgi:hypothetical protein